ncbi:MAG TPA: RNase adapter RapZ [Chthonomonadaceae bacterium]|nr:RNase adapter RapZ [Chthonomonadaceae bacterium]
MRIVVITGPAGAGKTLALHSFEDAGYYPVDNLPPRLLPALGAFCREEGRKGAAVVVDTRSGAAFDELPTILAEQSKAGLRIETIFLDASDDALVHRFKETRRPHPLLSDPTDGIGEGGIVEAIHAERALLQTMRTLADMVIDTSALTPVQLREAIHAAYADESRPGLLVTVTSFGFKHGLPIDADLVFDVRFLVNPHYVPALKGLDGRDPRVSEYVHTDTLTAPFQQRMTDLVEFTLPEYQREGKAYLTVAIGCTGGQHRSVVLAEDLARELRSKGFHVIVRHRDIGRNRSQDLAPEDGRDVLLWDRFPAFSTLPLSASVPLTVLNTEPQTNGEANDGERLRPAAHAAKPDKTGKPAEAKKARTGTRHREGRLP